MSHRTVSERYQVGTYETSHDLANAAREAKERGFDRFLIVDADAHHYELDSLADILSYIEDPVLRDNALYGDRQEIVSQRPGAQDLGGRILRYKLRRKERTPEEVSRDIAMIRQSMDAMGIDYTVVFPNGMLAMGISTRPELEAQYAKAYARWLTETITANEPRIKTMLYLPFNDPETSLAMVKEFSDKPGVVGFMVTSVRYQPIHGNAYMKIYHELEERGLPLAFHSAHPTNRSFEQFNRFLSIHAIGFPFSNMVHITNWVINGMPERFPRLKVLWIEGGVAYLPFLMKRLDHSYFMRTSEAPLLRKPPSEYIREMYFTSQPLEYSFGPTDWLESVFELIDAENQLLYASDFPHWDFDPPSSIYDLPFLSETAKRKILGENAAKLFRLR